MKHLLKIAFLLFFAVVFNFSSSAISTPVLDPVADKVSPSKLTVPSANTGITVKDFLAITPTKYKEITGKKMNFLQKLSLKMAQSKVKKQVKKGKIYDSSFIDFSDPVEKWFWFWIFGWGLGLIVLFLPVLWYLSSLLFLFGTISLIIWLIKKAA